MPRDKRIYYRAEKIGKNFKLTQRYYNTNQQVELLNIINLQIFINLITFFFKYLNLSLKAVKMVR